MAYFFKFTQSGKGIVTSSEPLNQTMETKNIGGVETQVRVQTGAASGEITFGFTAVKPEVASQMQVNVGDELPLEITGKPVMDNTTGEAVPNLYWAH